MYLTVLAIVLLLICILNIVAAIYYRDFGYSFSTWPREINYQGAEALAVLLVVCDLFWEIYKNLFKQKEKEAKEKQ